MTPLLALVGMACRYPDARSPAELWENALARRRAFRKIPPERLRLEDYLPGAAEEVDTTCATRAAVLEGYDFDRVRFRVGAAAFRSADLAHWLALDVAAEALADAGFPEAEGLPRSSTGVLVGNSLTGELSRADALRLRFPYVRRVVLAELERTSLSAEERRSFLGELEAGFKAPFLPPNEETLAGGLSNTIAGRICNHFDLQGGGYTVDGACASSLLAVTTACSALAAGDLDVALAGGVDLSLDPFELVGFARAGALAKETMRVYDARSAGFWPGEGAGFVVLMRLEEAIAAGKRVYATLRGWGVSSDGSGGLTRPEIKGQILALRRAYARAGFGVDTVSYFEGHGTGTSVGDTTELATLSLGRREQNPGAPPAAIGSIKANIGHTKAAAGVAGLIKATMAVHTQLLPPMTGCELPHPDLMGTAPALRIPMEGEVWPADRPLRAGVSAMGFGGINAHVVLEGHAPIRRSGLTPRETTLLSTQDSELFLFGANTLEELAVQIDRCLVLAPRLSLAELGDLAASLERELDRSPLRAAVLASEPDELAARLSMLLAWLSSGKSQGIEPAAGIFLGSGEVEPRIGFLFPGQGAPVYPDGGALGRRFEAARQTYRSHPLPGITAARSSRAAQPAIALASFTALRVLAELGLSASAAVGHSLGELSALHWAGAFDGSALLRIAERRGSAFDELGSPGGAMAAIEAGARETAALRRSGSVVIAGRNGPEQTVISGESSAVDGVVREARAGGFSAVRLNVSHAFHSPAMAAAAPALLAHLSNEPFVHPTRRVISTVTGAPLDPESDLRELLTRQVTLPVRFDEAMAHLERQVDLLIEVGPGQALGALAAKRGTAPVLSIDAGGPSLRGLLSAVGAAFALGASVDTEALFSGRFVRPFDLDYTPRFLRNPCETAPIGFAENEELTNEELRMKNGVGRSKGGGVFGAPPRGSEAMPALDLVFQLVMERTQLPRAALHAESKLLGDLHLSSITVGQLVIEAAQRLGLPPSSAPTDYANASIAELGQALEERGRGGKATAAPLLPPGVEAWVRAFEVEWVERPRRAGSAAPRPRLHLLAPIDHPLRAALAEALPGQGAVEGALVCLPPELDLASISLLLEGARVCRAIEGPSRFVLVHHGVGAAFARTLHLEMPWTKTAVIEVPLNHPGAAAWVLDEIAAGFHFIEARVDSTGARRTPALKLLPTSTEPGELPMSRADVVLVTGGGKGIAAECALSLARETGARLALLGRSEPEADRELSTNLERMAAAGVNALYLRADVTEAGAVQAAIAEIHRAFGPITGLLHGAGLNTPTAIGALDVAAVSRTLAVKLDGLQHVLSAIEPERLKVLVGFSSIIGRAGLRGEADYALANEELSRRIVRFGAEHPRCLCRSIEWSVWSGVGMGEKLGHMEALVREGITPIPPDQGVAMLDRLLRDRRAPVVTVVTGRFANSKTLEVTRPELPLLRFLEQPIVHVPGVELIAESVLSVGADPYLDDHVVSGEPLFPAVMMMEAMAQVAVALRETTRIPIFEELAFLRPVAVPRGAELRIRVCALCRSSELVEVVLRCESSGFQVDHARARCRFEPSPEALGEASLLVDTTSPAQVALDPETEMYGSVLFHQGRFRRLTGYRRLSSTRCVAEIAGATRVGWFGAFLPQTSILGDPALRDAAMHAIQACVPHRTLLPIGLGRLERGLALEGAGALVEARERSCDGDTFVYDVSIQDSSGSIVERWEGLVLKAIRGGELSAPLPEALLGPYLERQLRELGSGVEIAAAFHHAPGLARVVRSDRAMQQAAGHAAVIRRRGDGKPEVVGEPRLAVSAAHSGDSTLAVAGSAPLGCDLELVVSRPISVWRELLGPERFYLAELVAKEAGEELGAAATRIWTAGEALKKASVAPGAPLVLSSVLARGWVELRSGSLRVFSVVLSTRRREGRLAIAVLTGGRDAGV